MSVSALVAQDDHAFEFSPAFAVPDDIKAHPDQVMRRGLWDLGCNGVNSTEELLRRLAFNDETVLGMVLTGGVGRGHERALTAKTGLLVRLAALLTVGAGTPSLRHAAEQACAAGATEGEIVDVLVTVGPTIGLAGLVAAAPRLAVAIGYDLENGHDPDRDRESGDPPSSRR